MVSIRQIAKKDRTRRRKYKLIETQIKKYRYDKVIAKRIGHTPLGLISGGRYPYKNTCLVTGSSHSVYGKHLRLSRNTIKSYFRYITTLQLSSW